jgi:hypothetical protein
VDRTNDQIRGTFYWEDGSGDVVRNVTEEKQNRRTALRITTMRVPISCGVDDMKLGRYREVYNENPR